MKRRDAVDNVLRLLRADPAFGAWAAPFDALETAWSACGEPAWMLWLLETLELRDGRACRLFAVACAGRVRSLAGGGAGEQALEMAERVARGEASAKELGPAYRAARRHAEALADRVDFSEAAAAAAAAVTATVRERAFDAANDASREALRAVMWDLEGARSASDEAAWQAAELRRLVQDEIGEVLDRARARTRGKLAIR